MRTGTIIYEIQASVRADLRADWESYMRGEHVPEVVAAGGFLGATLERGEEGRYRIRYLAPDRERLEAYRRDAAPRLRQAALDRFPAGVELAREDWEVLAGW